MFAVGIVIVAGTYAAPEPIGIFQMLVESNGWSSGLRYEDASSPASSDGLDVSGRRGASAGVFPSDAPSPGDVASVAVPPSTGPDDGGPASGPWGEASPAP